MKNGWTFTLMILLAMGLAQSTLSFNTQRGYQAIVTLANNSARIQIAGHAYTLQVQFAGDIAPNPSTLSSIVDLVVLWAESSHIAEGFSGCVLEVSANILPEGTLNGVGVSDCTGLPSTMLYLLYLPQQGQEVT